MKILILYTGGTIGMKASADGFVPMEHFEQYFTDTLKMRCNTVLPMFDFVSLDMLIDSANLVPNNWTLIGNKLLALWQDYNGFVVLHGTDTMAYTASALSFMFQGNDKPIIITGSQIPLSEKHNDAYENVIQSLQLATYSDLKEVCICFNGKILRGNRSTKVKSSEFDAFNSPNYPSLGAVNGEIQLHSNLQRLPEALRFLVPKFDCDAVMVLQIFPGISEVAFDGIFNQNRFKAIIIKTYGMGNSPNVDSPLMRIMARAVSQGLIVLNVTQCMQGGVNQETYSTGSHMKKLGVIAGKDMTLEAAFTKLHFLLARGLNTAEIKQQLNVALAGELSY
ncbi:MULTISPECIES: asparaginase [Pseudoalteromonas]|jgi:L-asparaginase|uniref:asparaginase n=1 Tax=Pseudoalteromonas TaxID=53246 RepID=UPI000C3432FF|nr:MULTISPECIES: asparaginase [Pseudoalteromonas]PKG63520.1 L-asparaginase 1 [Pseudoalteromonas arctica]PKG68573.1 L-asparaginase 1 [Pseudoalteromonas sp. GutCa3]PKG68700.1 L-asparaginase 1 [Pseudoalteromonas sp. GutCa3]